MNDTTQNNPHDSVVQDGTNRPDSEKRLKEYDPAVGQYLEEIDPATGTPY